MNKLSLLLVEDEPFLAQVIKDSLEQQNYNVVYSADGRKAYNLFLNQHFDGCIIDVMLPNTDGFTLVRQIRAQGSTVPILFLTARTTTLDVIEGYQSGGNDYLKKPFSLEELFLRINELIKRHTSTSKQHDDRLFIGNYIFILHKQTLQLGHFDEIQLSYRETQLLKLLYDYRNELLERKHALITLWGDDSFFNTRTMDVFITRLRKHLRNDSSVQIINMRGLGYKLIC